MKTPFILRGRARTCFVALALLGCASHTEHPAGGRESRQEDDVPEPVCDPLPRTRPPGVVLGVHRVDGESLTHVLDVALVADAECPKRSTLEDPACVRLTDDAMDYVWNELVAAAPHEIALERHGECIHCGGPGFAVTWPDGRCERGRDHWHDISQGSEDRFARALQVLEAAAAAGGVTPTAPPR